MQADIDSIRGCCASNCMRIDADKTRVINFKRKINLINYNYVLCHKCVIRTDSIEDLGVLIVSKLFFSPACWLHMFSAPGTCAYVDIFLLYY